MKSTLLFARYVLFGLFVVCNAIICSVAVWNHSLVLADGGQTLQVDVYLIFLGAFSLAFILPIIFADLLCEDPPSAQVWFECAWVALIWLMHLAGAAAVTAIAPPTQCIAQVNNDPCLSTRVLLAFTWICTMILLLYLFLLVVTAVTTQWIDPGVWHHNVRYLRIGTTRQCLPSAQNSPSTPHFNTGRGKSDLHKPRPLRSVPQHPVYGYRAGLDPEYEIEHYRPYAPEQMTVDSALSLPEAIPTVSYPSPAFVYSQRIRGSIPLQTGPLPAPSRLDTSIVYANPVQSLIPAQQAPASPPHLSPSAPSSSPFDWPRANVMEQPVKTKRKPPPSAFEFPRRSAQGPSELPSNPPADSLSHPRTRRPSGPRMRTSSGDETQHPASYLARPIDKTAA